MTEINIYELRNSSILRVYSEKELIQTDPEYQRMSGVWNKEKRQFLMDTIINDFDIPKLYFHEFEQAKELVKGKKIKYAIIDGRQRIESIWKFIEGRFELANDFVYYKNPSVSAGGMTYGDLSAKYPELKTQIDSYVLPIMIVRTHDLELIEEMFVRLNEAVPLNAAEKRNAFGGPLPRIITQISTHSFFREKVAFPNNRFQHREVATKLLLLRYSKKIIDTKKIYLDNFVNDFKENNMTEEANRIGQEVSNILDHLYHIFVERDILLRTQAMLVLYFLIAQVAIGNKLIASLTRDKLVQFEDLRIQNRKTAEEDMGKANFDLLEFDRMSLQGSNDKENIRNRFELLTSFI